MSMALSSMMSPGPRKDAAVAARLGAKRKRAQGLEVVSLMFEQFGDFGRAAEATYRFRDSYG
ncbi:MAG: hypothetical protein EBU14_12400, partial [Acetobacteraceae bacterium]|nr:hypothetical protein [Acetobacteraceae bacterium]